MISYTMSWMGENMEPLSNSYQNKLKLWTVGPKLIKRQLNPAKFNETSSGPRRGGGKILISSQSPTFLRHSYHFICFYLKTRYFLCVLKKSMI